jgi:hypothetical protein
MLYAIDKNLGNKVGIQQAIDDGGYYKCTICGDDVIVRNGDVRIPHFAHKSLRICDSWYSTENAMSEWHRDWQSQYAQRYREVPVEINGEKHIADVQFGNYVVEFQHSPMTADAFMKRTRFYTQKYKLIWVFDFIDISNYDDYYDAPLHTQYGEFDKFIWKNQKPTFEEFNPRDWYGKVYLVFEIYSRKYGTMLKQVTWCAEDDYRYNYKRFATQDFKLKTYPG